MTDSEHCTHTEPPEPPELEQRRSARALLRSRRAQSLARLLGERTDLRGVHALADFVDDGVSWTA